MSEISCMTESLLRFRMNFCPWTWNNFDRDKNSSLALRDLNDAEYCLSLTSVVFYCKWSLSKEIIEGLGYQLTG